MSIITITIHKVDKTLTTHKKHYIFSCSENSYDYIIDKE